MSSMLPFKSLTRRAPKMLVHAKKKLFSYMGYMKNGSPIWQPNKKARGHTLYPQSSANLYLSACFLEKCFQCGINANYGTRTFIIGFAHVRDAEHYWLRVKRGCHILDDSNLINILWIYVCTMPVCGICSKYWRWSSWLGEERTRRRS